MTAEIRRYGAAAVRSVRMPLDYYAVLSEADGDEPEGLVVEEFDLAGDLTATGLNNAGWTAGENRWWSSAGFSRAMRVDPKLRGRLIATDRRDAESVYRRLGGGDLPDESTLRTRFSDRLRLASPPLRLTPQRPPKGFTSRRLYRLLFANDLTADALTHVAAMWDMPLTDDPEPKARVVGTAERHTPYDSFTWELRRVGPGSKAAWCVDLTACLGGRSDTTLGVVLWELRSVLRYAGLIPVTIERFG